MIVGVPKRSKPVNTASGWCPAACVHLTAKGHQVLVEKGAGVGSGLPDSSSPRSAPRWSAARKRSGTRRK